MSLQLLFLSSELLQLIGPGEDTCFLIDGTAGHGTAGVHDLTVQGDDLEAGSKWLCHGDGAVDVFTDDGAAQQILHDAPVLLLAANQVAGHTHIASGRFQAVLLEPPSADGVHGQEGGASAAGAL